LQDLKYHAFSAAPSSDDRGKILLLLAVHEVHASGLWQGAGDFAYVFRLVRRILGLLPDHTERDQREEQYRQAHTDRGSLRAACISTLGPEVLNFCFISKALS
jgi:hypothetical protein